VQVNNRIKPTCHALLTSKRIIRTKKSVCRKRELDVELRCITVKMNDWELHNT